MPAPRSILMVSSECVPFAKTGGLADAVGGLSKALADLGHEVSIVMPLYGALRPYRGSLQPFLAPLGVWMGHALEWCAVQMAAVDGVCCYFVEHERCFARDGLYHDAEFRDHPDNAPRFGLLARAALQLCRDGGLAPDVVHAHDWQAALVPAYLDLHYRRESPLAGAASALTIHNIAHQGIHDAGSYEYLALGWENFVPECFEDHGRTNFLKGGLHFADQSNTVSPTHAAETLTPEGGHGLAPYLRALGDRYTGILNGVDARDWDPVKDRFLPARYGPDDVDEGKARCKHALQERLGLQVDPAAPLIGIVSRLAVQKGMDVLAAAIEPMLGATGLQFAILGAGEKRQERFYAALPERFPGRVASRIGFDEELAHWIEAGADFFLMPSRHEPCGLNQIYSMRYGTLPIVRATGGLVDTVRVYDERTAEGTGFVFHDLTPRSIHDAVLWAVGTYLDRPDHVRRMRRAAMAEDFSWERSARSYEALYERAIARRRSA